MSSMHNGWPKRFPLILVASVVLHFGFLAGIFGSWVYHTSLKWGSLGFGSDGDAQFLDELDDDGLDRTKPFILPKGFYVAQQQAVEEANRKREQAERERRERIAREKAERERIAREKAEREKLKQAKVEDAKPANENTPGEEAKPANPGQFGRINGGAFKPHIKKVYAAYESGALAIDTFTISVSCRALPDGSLTDIQIVQSSGNKMIDQTAMVIFRELSAMKALAPLSSLSSLSLTLAKDRETTSMTAVGFAANEGDSEEFGNQIGLLAMGARFKTAGNPDQSAIANSIRVASSGTRVSISASLPNSRVAEMMQRSFGSTETAEN